MSTREKIPYDASPISRDYNMPQSRATVSASSGGKISKLLVFGLFVFNIVISCLFVYYLFSGGRDVTINYNGDVYSSRSVIAVASSKAKLSTVCIGVGGRNSSGEFSQSHVPNNNELFNSVSERGSGVIVSINKNDGTAFIVTCQHVVAPNPSAVFVLLYDQVQPVYASVVGSSTSQDVAVLKIETEQLKTSAVSAANFADSSLVAEGDDVIAIGNPRSEGITTTVGVVSNPMILVNTTTRSNLRTIKIDATINPGNSGGGLFNQDGNLIGLVESRASNYGDVGFAYAIHSNTVASLYENITEGRELKYADAGYTVGIDSYELVLDNGVIYKRPVVKVTSITGSNVQSAGLRVGDIIIGFSYRGRSVQFNSLYSYEEIKFSLRVGDQITYNISRAGRAQTITVTVTSYTQQT